MVLMESEANQRRYLRLSYDAQRVLLSAARDVEPVRGLTHGFYKYPARFSPVFAGIAIKCFTAPGDLVLDPHVGGGTALVEALALGREAVGVDISSLAEFVSEVKCTVFSDAELTALDRWASEVARSVDMHRPSTSSCTYMALGYYKHLDHPMRWRLRKAIDQSLASAVGLRTRRLQNFGRCVVLRTAQWALDGRRKHVSVEEFRQALGRTAWEMARGARDFKVAVEKNGRRPVTILCRSAAGIEAENSLAEMRAPRLVITSPPYPGVHVLYHRWQVDGRKEAPLPFVIANKLDGAGGSYYTMGDRKFPELKTYFANIKASMASIASLANAETVIVQMVAFSEPDWQLSRYLEAMEGAGLSEVFLPSLRGEGDGRLWRSVPGRRWYNAQRGNTPSSEEVVLFHKKG